MGTECLLPEIEYLTLGLTRRMNGSLYSLFFTLRTIRAEDSGAVRKVAVFQH